MTYQNPPMPPRKSATFDDHTLAEIRRAAATGIYDIRGGGTKRKLPHFDDLLFLGASISRYPLEGYRENCGTGRHARHALRQKADRAEDPDHHRRHELRLAVGQRQGGARPRRDAGRHLHHHRRRRHDRRGARPFPDPGLSVPAVPLRHEPATISGAPTPSRWWSARAPSPAAAACCSARRSPTASPPCATCPKGIDQRSACRHPDWTGPDDLEIKIEELREITDWEKPIYVKVGGARPYYDTALAVKAGADVVVLDGMQGGTAATQDVFIEHVGMPTLAAIRPAVQALQDLGMHRKVQLDRLGRHPHRAPTSPRPWRWAPTRSRSAPRRWSRSATTTRPGGGVPQARHHRRRLRRLARRPRPGRHHHAGSRADGPARSGAAGGGSPTI